MTELDFHDARIIPNDANVNSNNKSFLFPMLIALSSWPAIGYQLGEQPTGREFEEATPVTKICDVLQLATTVVRHSMTLHL